MDRIESLTNSLSQITMYDIKNMYNQAKNVVFNVSEMEAKVRDATNDEAWGASSTLMQEIAQGTFNFQNFNEIMPCIYARFMEKEARQWRQIYKALQLLEYLVKNGSERVVDDARSHIATIKMLRNFYYIDEKGKDQGLNVRNRSKELVELLGDVDKIRSERRKAKANKSKYTGTGNDGMGFGSGSSRYGGFGSESGTFYGGGYGGSSSSGQGGSNSRYGGSGSGDYSSRDYGDYSSGGSGGFRDSGSRKGYEEYDAGDDDTVAAHAGNSLSSPTSPRSSTTTAPISRAKAKAPEPAPAPIANLLDFDDDFSAPAAPVAAPVQAPPAAASAFDNDDDFGGFQDAPSPGISTNFSAPIAPIAPVLSNIQKPASPPIPATYQQPNNNLFNMLSTTTSSPPPMAASRPPPYMGGAMTPTLTPSVQSQGSMFGSPAIPSRSAPMTPSGGLGTSTQAKPAASGGNFDDLWSMSLGTKSSAPKPSAPSTQGKSIKDLEREKAQAGIWGGGSQAQTRPPMGYGFGSFGSSTGSNAPALSSGGGLDDLLG